MYTQAELNAQVIEYNAKTQAACQALAAQVTAIQTSIADIQGSPSVKSPEDRKTLDSLEVQAMALSTKLSAIQAVPMPVQTD